jgi:phenylpropionate dioxygenase-like ring-hydroxylating dioxygenase large terminal subunit
MRSTRAATSLGGWLAARLPEDLRALHGGRETPVAADWKIVVEQWLGRAPRSAPDGVQAGALEWSTRPWERADWTARHYRNLSGTPGDGSGLNLYLAPNQWLESRPDGLTVLQVMPTAPGHCLLRELDFTRCKAQRGGRALAYLAARARAPSRSRSLAESTQRGILDFGYRAGQTSAATSALAWFRRHLIERVPALGLDRPPTDG